jgi:dTDP-4-dehydrorhamnose 3,5-epimerase-like enzyme
MEHATRGLVCHGVEADRNMDTRNIQWLAFQSVVDERGRLTVIEGNNHVPFQIARVFYVHEVAAGTDRGGHAHRDTDQVLTCIHGCMKVDAADGHRVSTFVLDDAKRGLYVPRMLFVRLYDFTPGAVLLVLANTVYDRSRSLRSWHEYLTARDLPGEPDPFGGQGE